MFGPLAPDEEDDDDEYDDDEFHEADERAYRSFRAALDDDEDGFNSREQEIEAELQQMEYYFRQQADPLLELNSEAYRR